MECVKILAESVIRKLIDASISGTGWASLQGKLKEKKPQVKCTQCEKVFNSEQYMKSHRTRVHKEMEYTCSNDGELTLHKNRLHLEPKTRKRLAEQANFECLKCSKTFNTTLEKTFHDDNVHSCSVVSHCEDCDMSFKGNDILENILHIQNHKVSHCFSKKQKTQINTLDCKKCNYIGKSEYELKNHMRDEHDVVSASNSPAPKKSKNTLDDENDLMWLEFL